MKNKAFFPFILFLFFSGFIQAAPPLDHPLTLSELIDIALENHPSTRQAWWNAHRAAATVGTARSLYYPNINLAASAKKGQDFKFINGPDTNYTIMGADIFLDMLLFDFGERRAVLNIAKTSLIAANWQVDWEVQKVMVRVLENAYSTMLAEEVVQGSTISLKEAEKVLNAAKELNRTGLSPVTDVYTAQATYSLMKMELSQHQGLSAATNVEIVVPENIPCEQMEQLDTLISVALDQRADLIAKQAKLQEMVFNEARVRYSFWPKVSFGARTGYNRYVEDKSDAAQYQVSINLEAPLFNGFDTMYRNRIAYADTQITNEQLIELQLDITLEVLTHSRMVTAAKEMLPEANDNLNNSTRAYEGVLSKYKAGKEGITELSYAQRTLAAARVRYSQVKTKLLVSIANLAYATGTLAPYMETPCQEKP
jgi:outer membrane protein TolC